MDIFRFFAEGGDTYTLEVVLGTHGDTFLTLYDEDGFVLETDDDAPGLEGGSRITFTAPFDGDYFFEVRSVDQATDIGSYFINLFSAFEDDHGDTLETATDISPGSVFGVIDPASELDVFRFFGEASTTYIIGAQPESHPGLAVALLNDIGTLLEEIESADTGGSFSSISLSTPATASEYFVVVGSIDENSGTGSYFLSLTSLQDDHGQDDHGSRMGSATPISLGSTFGTIEEPSDIDFFRFASKAGETYVITVTPDGHPDTVLALYHFRGLKIEENDDFEGLDGGSRIIWTATRGDDYFLAVRSFDQITQTWSYILTLDREQEVSLGGFYEGTITSFEDGTTGDLELSLEEEGGRVTGNLTLFDPHVGSGEIESGSFEDGNLKFTVSAIYQRVSFSCEYFVGPVRDPSSLDGGYECFFSNGQAGDSGEWSASR